jgi:glucokinase
MDRATGRDSRDPSTLTVGVDIGGTNIRAGVVDADGEVLDTVHAPTPRSSRSLDRALENVIRELMGRHTVTGVGLAIAGFLTSDRKTVRFAPHLPWREAKVGKTLGARLELPVVLEHDANSAAWAEYRFGAAKGGENVAIIAIGTGIGAALLIKGKLYRGSHGIAPELGHIQVVPDGRSCACGKRGCLERYCSGTALVDTAIEILSSEPMLPHSPFSASPLARDIRLDPGSVSGRRITAAAQDGDPLGQMVLSEFARWLGITLALVSDIYDPDMIVIGGGVGSSAPMFMDEAREHFATLITGAGHRPLARIRRAQMGEAAAMIGAADLARHA